MPHSKLGHAVKILTWIVHFDFIPYFNEGTTFRNLFIIIILILFMLWMRRPLLTNIILLIFITIVACLQLIKQGGHREKYCSGFSFVCCFFCFYLFIFYLKHEYASICLDRWFFGWRYLSDIGFNHSSFSSIWSSLLDFW